MRELKVDDLGNFEFWLGMFKPRTRGWQNKALKRLKANKSIFETDKERQDKIKALNFLLGKGA